MTVPAAAIEIFLSLIDGRTAPGTLADFLSLRRKQLFLFLRDGGIIFDKPRRHCFNATHEAVRVGVPFCNLRQGVFPFGGQLRACEGVGQDGDKVLAVFGGDKLLFLPLHKARLHKFFQYRRTGGGSA